jgi:tetratricopeptide (TPR) repeat protein
MGKAPKKSRTKKSRKKTEPKNDSLSQGFEPTDLASAKPKVGDEPSSRSLSPAIEADFILGDYLKQLITSKQRQEESEPQLSLADAANFVEPEPLEPQDISDSVIDSFLKNLSVNLDQNSASLAETEMEAETAAPEKIAEKDDAFAATPEILLSQIETPASVDEIFPEESTFVSEEEKIIGETPTTLTERGEIQTAEPPSATPFIPPPEVAEPAPVSEHDASLESAAEETIDEIFGLQSRSEEVPSAFVPPPPVAEPIPPAPVREEEPKALAEIQHCLLNGIQSYRVGEYEDAIIEFKKVLKLDPEHQAAYQMLGNAYFRNRMLSEALAVYEQYKKKYPVNAIVHENLGIIYARLGVFQLAIKEWQSLLKLQPDRSDIVRKIENAKPYLDQAPPISKAPLDNKIQLLNSGVEHYISKNYGAAIQDFARAIQQYPDAKEVYCFLGNAYFRNNQLREAAAAYEKAKQLDSTDLTAYENMGVIYARLGACELALKEWEKALELNPNRKDIEDRVKKVLKKMQPYPV